MTDVGVYIHVPFCKHACPYCDFYKIELGIIPASTRLAFTNVVARELALNIMHDEPLAERTLATIYFGGGTPSTLKPEFVTELLGSIRSSFAVVSPTLEITLEANPENLTEQRCAKWFAAGINRLSIGVQSFAINHLRDLERMHNADVIEEAIANARVAGFTNMSLDLMFALPGQTMEDWQETLRRAVQLQPDHLSFYGLTYHEGTPFFEQRSRGELVEISDDLNAEMYLFGHEFLTANGFEHYEISNYARPGRRSQHNQRYWSRRDVLGLGPGAHSNMGIMRWSNPPDLNAWQANVESDRLPQKPAEPLSEVQVAEEKLFTMLRRVEGLCAGEDDALLTAARRWYEKNLPESASKAINDETGFRLNVSGWLISDFIIGKIVEEYGG